MPTESIHRSAKGTLERVIVAIAGRQHGVIALWQLVSLGLSESAVRSASPPAAYTESIKASMPSAALT
jgi:hypothetical protein